MARPSSIAHSDFGEAFRDQNRFRSKDGVIKTATINVGRLQVPSGQVVVVDPGWFSFVDSQPLRTRAPIGTHDVLICEASMDRCRYVAAAMLRFAKTKPVSFKLSTKTGQRLSDLADGEFFGVGVDTGTACFVDHTFVRRQDQEEAAENAEEIANAMHKGRKPPLHASLPVSDTCLLYTSDAADE